MNNNNNNNGKNLGLAYILGLIFPPLALHRHYLGKHGSAIIQMLLWSVSFHSFGLGHIGVFGGIGLIWFIVDMFLLPSMVKEKNRKISGAYPNVYIENHKNNQFVREVKTEKDIEKDILKLAKKNNGRLTATTTAMETDLSLIEAEEYLQKMVSSGYINMVVSEGGVIIYEFIEYIDNDINNLQN